MIETAIKSLNYDKNSGCEYLRAKNSKYTLSEIIEAIAVLLNYVAQTGIYPEEIKTGPLKPFKKPGKPKRPPKNEQRTTSSFASHSPINTQKSSSNMPYRRDLRKIT